MNEIKTTHKGTEHKGSYVFDRKSDCVTVYYKGEEKSARPFLREPDGKIMAGQLLREILVKIYGK